MAWIARCLHIPASETQKTFVIAACVVAMSIMAVGLVWQAEIIAHLCSFEPAGSYPLARSCKGRRLRF
jgi:hypothetical protein